MSDVTAVTISTIYRISCKIIGNNLLPPYSDSCQHKDKCMGCNIWFVPWQSDISDELVSGNIVDFCSKSKMSLCISLEKLICCIRRESVRSDVTWNIDQLCYVKSAVSKEDTVPRNLARRWKESEMARARSLSRILTMTLERDW
ncbi:uncharacterized protein LOC125501653 isoform X1 [Athalia rosae]|uniref:uncharacterized protein LOC125501653 isoform X1 n=1 Tax=Athalia rosae TaxID=37344 RepID=UPI0020344260|nr:uncharacterized protein LOC125501653 isoform X1 [Athalia rosae]